MNRILTVPAMGDNFIHIYVYHPGRCMVIDPGNASTVIKALEAHNLQPTHILVTHHHYDHIGGADRLKSRYHAVVIGPDRRRITCQDRDVSDNDLLSIGDAQIRVIATPGHTSTSVCYHFLSADSGSGSGPDTVPGALFTGDTMFVAGCGRPFESDYETMYQSMQRLASLPDDTLVYPGHDYTEENYRFAITVDPDNAAIRQSLAELRDAPGQAGHVPSTIAKEKQTNVFIMATSPKNFADLRKRKDRF